MTDGLEEGINRLVIFGGTNPETARERYVIQGHRDLAIIAVAFVVGVLLLSPVLWSIFPRSWLPVLALDLVALFLANYFYLILRSRPILISCRSCENLVTTNIPWQCSVCRKSNYNANEFPFVSKCQHCGSEPMAYRCHHLVDTTEMQKGDQAKKPCGNFIFLSNIRDRTHYACALNSLGPLEEQLPVDQHEGALRTLRESKEIKREELEIAGLEAELEQIEESRQKSGPKKRTAKEALEDELNAIMEGEDSKEEILRKLEVQYAGDPKKLKRRKLALKQAMRKRLGGE